MKKPSIYFLLIPLSILSNFALADNKTDFICDQLNKNHCSVLCTSDAPIPALSKSQVTKLSIKKSLHKTTLDGEFINTKAYVANYDSISTTSNFNALFNNSVNCVVFGMTKKGN